MLRHSVFLPLPTLHFLPNSEGIACLVAEFLEWGSNPQLVAFTVTLCASAPRLTNKPLSCDYLFHQNAISISRGIFLGRGELYFTFEQICSCKRCFSLIFQGNFFVSKICRVGTGLFRSGPGPFGSFYSHENAADAQLISEIINYEVGRGAGAQSVTVKSTGYGFDPSRKLNIYLHLYFNFFALVSRQSRTLSSAIQHAMPPKFGGK